MQPFLGPLERLRLVRDGYYASDRRRRRRASMVLALDRGQTPAQVARTAGVARTTVYGWLRRYLEDRDPASLSGRETGRPARPPDPSRSRAVSRLVGGPSPHRGRLQRDRPRFEAASKAARGRDRRARLRAEVLLAIDRGVSVTKVAGAARWSRQTIYQAWKSEVVRPGEGRGGLRTARGRAKLIVPPGAQ